MTSSAEYGLDAERIERALKALGEAMSDDDDPPNEHLMLIERGGKRLAVLLLKRTYAVEQGRCMLASEDDQSPVFIADVPVTEDLPAPFVSPLFAANEAFALKPGTDVIIQANACPLDHQTRRMTVSARFGKHSRELVVYGDRRGEFDALGRPRFSEPEPIEEVAIRWDNAYGGFDKVACERSGYPRLLRQILDKRPEWDAARATPFHYPRNPAGRGYLMRLDKESFDGLWLPNLEHPGALLTPERLAVGDPRAWLRGPLPAAWDYQEASWFPRCAYLGLTPEYQDDGNAPAEVKRGWATEDLLSIPSLLKARSPDEARIEHAQAAAPGMVFFDLAPDETFVLTNLYPGKATHSIKLPGETPAVGFELSPGKLSEASVHLYSVVLRVAMREVDMLWAARIEMPPALSEEELAGCRRMVQWKRPAEKG